MGRGRRGCMGVRKHESFRILDLSIPVPPELPERPHRDVEQPFRDLYSFREIGQIEAGSILVHPPPHRAVVEPSDTQARFIGEEPSSPCFARGSLIRWAARKDESVPIFQVKPIVASHLMRELLIATLPTSNDLIRVGAARLLESISNRLVDTCAAGCQFVHLPLHVGERGEQQRVLSATSVTATSPVDTQQV